VVVDVRSSEEGRDVIAGMTEDMSLRMLSESV